MSFYGSHVCLICLHCALWVHIESTEEINMNTDVKKSKIFPTILINIKARDGQILDKTFGQHQNLANRSRTADSHSLSIRTRTSSISSTKSAKGRKDLSNLSRSSSVLSLAARAPLLRGRKKREAEYVAEKLIRQRQEMSEFYSGTPMTNPLATSSEIIRFLYELWVPQLSSNYRKDVPVTTNCRQDLKNVRKIAQTTPRHGRKLHRAKLVIDTCNQMVKPMGLESRSSSALSISVT